MVCFLFDLLLFAMIFSMEANICLLHAMVNYGRHESEFLSADWKLLLHNLLHLIKL